MITLIQENEYESITVQAILDQANVGRSTFYLHYQGGKEDLLLDLFADLQMMLETNVAELFQDNGGNLSLALFQYAEGHFRFYEATSGKQSGTILNSYVQTYLASYLRDHLQPLLREESRPFFPLDAVVQHAVGSFMALLTWWLDNGRPNSAEEMAQIYKQLSTLGIAPLLDPTGIESFL